MKTLALLCSLIAMTTLATHAASIYDIKLKDIDGKDTTLAAYKGKVVLIDFWASWCAPCIIEIPHLNALQKQFGPKGFQVVGIAMDDSEAVTRQTMQKYPFAYPVVLGDAKFGNLYGGVLGLPLKYLVGADGKILAIWSGEIAPATIDKGVREAVAQAGKS